MTQPTLIIGVAFSVTFQHFLIDKKKHKMPDNIKLNLNISD